MASITKDTVVRAPVAHVWSALRDFGGLHDRLAAGFVTDTRLEGNSDRVVTFFNGATAHERLVAVDDNRHRLVYAVVDSPFATAHDNSSVQAVALDGDRTQLVWTKDVLPDDVARRVARAMEHGLATMKANLEKTYAENAGHPSRTPAHLLALGTVAGPVLLTVAWFVLGFINEGYELFGVRVPGYSPISQPISGLGMGSTAPFMNAAFALNGLLLGIGILAVFHTTREDGPPTLRRVSTALLLLVPLGSVMDGLFDLEAMMLHSLGFFLATGTPVVTFLVAGSYLRRIHRWRRFGTRLVIGSPLTLVLLVAFALTFTPTIEGMTHGVSGLVQRLLVLEVLAWPAAMGYHAWRGAGPTSRPMSQR